MLKETGGITVSAACKPIGVASIDQVPMFTERAPLHQVSQMYSLHTFIVWMDRPAVLRYMLLHPSRPFRVRATSGSTSCAPEASL